MVELPTGRRRSFLKTPLAAAVAPPPGLHPEPPWRARNFGHTRFRRTDCVAGRQSVRECCPAVMVRLLHLPWPATTHLLAPWESGRCDASWRQPRAS